MVVTKMNVKHYKKHKILIHTFTERTEDKANDNNNNNKNNNNNNNNNI